LTLGEHYTHLFKRYVRKAGIADDRLHFHSLRHYAELGINVTRLPVGLCRGQVSVYFYRMRAGGFVQVRKMLLLR
jgi:hypothetical protein